MANSKTILLVNELGGGLGHVAPLLSVAQKILSTSPGKSDVRIILASPDSVSSAKSLPELPFPLINAPVAMPVISLRSHTASYAEILTAFGFTRPNHLAASLRAWDDLIDLTKPDLIIADHSPSMCLAARGRIPVVQIGSGFTLPPDDVAQFPALYRNTSPPAVQQSMLHVINQVLAERNAPALDRLPELLRTEYRAIFSLPQFDPYQPIRNEPLLGSYHEHLGRLPTPKAPKFFIYAGTAMANLDLAVQLVSEANFPVEAYFGATDSVAARFLRSKGMIVHENPPEVHHVLKNASLVISQGGAGFSNAALIAGRPHIVIPSYAESQLTASRIMEMGVGISIEKDIETELPDAIENIMEDETYTQSAQAESEVIANSNFPDDASMLVAVEACKLLNL